MGMGVAGSYLKACEMTLEEMTLDGVGLLCCAHNGDFAAQESVAQCCACCKVEQKLLLGNFTATPFSLQSNSALT